MIKSTVYGCKLFRQFYLNQSKNRFVSVNRCIKRKSFLCLLFMKKAYIVTAVFTGSAFGVAGSAGRYTFIYIHLLIECSHLIFTVYLCLVLMRPTNPKPI